MTSKTTLCLVSTTNDCDLLISTEWNDSELTMRVKKDESTVLIGEMPYSNFEQQVKYFDKQMDDYVKWMQDILNGETDGIDFSLENDKLAWVKRSSSTHKKSCILGKIQLTGATYSDVVKFLENLVLRDAEQLKQINSLVKNNDIVNRELSTLREDFDEVVALKNQMETMLYTRFAIILNEKKAKIREQDSEIKKLKGKDRVYNVPTDESDCEDSREKAKSDTFREVSCKRSSHDDLGDVSKRKKTGDDVLPSEKSPEIQDNPMSHPRKQGGASSTDCGILATTSQDYEELKEDEDTPDFLSQESECEMELKFEEDRGNEVSPNVTGDQDSEELF